MAAPTTAWIVVDRTLFEYDIASSTVTQQVGSWGVETEFRSDLSLTPERDRAYFSASFEDGWYSCETAAGEVQTEPFPPAGEEAERGQETVAQGGQLAVGLSPDGTTLFYDVATDCTPDPNDVATVVTNSSALQLVDLESGTEMTVSLSASAIADGERIAGAAMAASDDLVVVTQPSSSIYRVTPTDGAIIDDGTLVGAGPRSSFSDGSRGAAHMIGADANGAYFASIEATSEEESKTIVTRVSFADGSTTELMTAAGWVAVGSDGHGNLIVVTTPDVAATAADPAGVDGTTLTIVTLEPEQLGFEPDRTINVEDVAW